MVSTASPAAFRKPRPSSAAFAAFEMARNVNVSGASDMAPWAVASGLNSGSSSLGPNASSTPLRWTRRACVLPPDSFVPPHRRAYSSRITKIAARSVNRAQHDLAGM